MTGLGGLRRLVSFRADGGPWTSAYTDPLVAALMAPVHAATDPAVQPWWIVAPVLRTDGLRYTVPTDAPRPVLPAALPPITLEQRTAFAILLGRAVYPDTRFRAWADDWLSDRDRTSTTALAVMGARPVPPDDRAYVAHWATMSAAFPTEATLPAQTAALVAANVCPQGTYNFADTAELALTIAP